MRRPFFVNMAVNCALAYAATISILHAITYGDTSSVIAGIFLPIVFTVSLVLTIYDMRQYIK